MTGWGQTGLWGKGPGEERKRRKGRKTANLRRALKSQASHSVSLKSACPHPPNRNKTTLHLLRLSLQIHRETVRQSTQSVWLPIILLTNAIVDHSPHPWVPSQRFSYPYPVGWGMEAWRIWESTPYILLGSVNPILSTR